MIAYFFPPEGNAGSYRPLRFVRSLSQMEWDVCIVSADPYRYERYDRGLLSLVPQEIHVSRVRGRNIWHAIQAWRGQRLQSMLSKGSSGLSEKVSAIHNAPFRSRVREVLRKVEACYYLPDMARPWIRPAVKSAVRLCASRHSNVIWATVGPLSSGLVALQVSEKTGIPYVLDFRDPWGLNYYSTELIRPKLVSHFFRRTMYRLLQRAQAVVFLFDTVAECFQRVYPGAVDDSRIHIIPNGYDGAIDDFETPQGERCTILYTGTLTTYRYDTFLQALSLLKKTSPFQANQIHVMFVGEGTVALQDKVATLGLSDIVTMRPSTSYAEILCLQKNAHAFLILGRESNRKGHELVAGAKLFGYLKARRPIIGILPHDETRKILDHVGVSTLADVDSPNEILRVIQQVFDSWEAGTLDALLPSGATCENYSAESQTLALIRALNGEMAETPFRSGTVSPPPSLAEDFLPFNF
ncbi:MAG: glycosyl transferase family 1 [Nitrospirales bacterium]|nr:MAG: glycosyl transferase family 1 [Nitrospirales bacterium]